MSILLQQQKNLPKFIVLELSQLYKHALPFEGLKKFCKIGKQKKNKQNIYLITLTEQVD